MKMSRISACPVDHSAPPPLCPCTGQPSPSEHEPTGWTFLWFECLGQQQQQMGVLVASSNKMRRRTNGEDIFGISVAAHFTL